MFPPASLVSGMLLGKSRKRLKLTVISIPNLVCPVFITCESNIMHCNSKSRSGFFQLHTSSSTENLNCGGEKGGNVSGVDNTSETFSSQERIFIRRM